MIIKGKTTGRTQSISVNVWEMMVTKGLARNFDIVSAGPESTPKTVEQSDYKTIVADGLRAFKEERFVAARTLLTQAQDIKHSPAVSRKLAQIPEPQDVQLPPKADDEK